MTKEDYLGKIVTLNEEFLTEAFGFDDNVPIKPMRPYLVVELEKEENKKQLYAIPMQSSIGDIDNNKFYTKLPRRLTAKMNSESGFIYSQMLPITINQIDSLKESEDMVPYKFDEKQTVLYNLKTMDPERVPEKVRQDFISMKKMAYAKYDIFTNDSFREKYSKVSNEIFQETIRVKNKMYENILQKAQNYLSIYQAFLQQLEDKRKYGAYQGKRIRLPRYYVRLDNMYNFVDEYNGIVKTSLQQDQGEKDEKPARNITRIYDNVRKMSFEVKGTPIQRPKLEPKTQEKNNTKQQPIAAKPKKKDGDFNCR